AVLDQARFEQERAELDLREKQQQVTAQANSLAGIYDQLKRLLANDPEVQRELEGVANAMGEPEVAQSYQALKEQADKVEGLGGSLLKIWQEIAKPDGLGSRLVVLIFFTSVCTIAAFGVNFLLHPQAGWMAALRHWISLAGGATLGVAAWLAPQ